LIYEETTEPLMELTSLESASQQNNYNEFEAILKLVAKDPAILEFEH